jgi:hypothetical protein
MGDVMLCSICATHSCADRGAIEALDRSADKRKERS